MKALLKNHIKESINTQRFALQASTKEEVSRLKELMNDYRIRVVHLQEMGFALQTIREAESVLDERFNPTYNFYNNL